MYYSGLFNLATYNRKGWPVLQTSPTKSLDSKNLHIKKCEKLRLTFGLILFRHLVKATRLTASRDRHVRQSCPIRRFPIKHVEKLVHGCGKISAASHQIGCCLIILDQAVAHQPPRQVWSGWPRAIPIPECGVCMSWSKYEKYFMWLSNMKFFQSAFKAFGRRIEEM